MRRHSEVLVESLHRRTPEVGFGNQESIKVGASAQIGSFTVRIEIAESEVPGIYTRDEEY